MLSLHRSHTPILVALCTIAALLLVGILHTLKYVGLYADGANFLLQILLSQNFYYADGYRTGVYYITQWPVLLALRLDQSSLGTLAGVHSAALTALPTTCFVATTWITRHNAIAAAANLLVICCC